MIATYQQLTKSWNSCENTPDGRRGGSLSTTCLIWSNKHFHSLYGNLPVATSICSDTQPANSHFQHVCDKSKHLQSFSPVYTIQPVVKPVWQPVVSCIQIFNRLSNPFHNRFHKRLYRVYSRLSNWLWMNSGCSFNTVVKPVVKHVWEPIWQRDVSRIRTLNRLSIGLRTGWMFVYTIPPVVWQLDVSCKWSFYNTWPSPVIKTQDQDQDRDIWVARSRSKVYIQYLQEE